jgi:MFS family permease
LVARDDAAGVAERVHDEGTRHAIAPSILELESSSQERSRLPLRLLFGISISWMGVSLLTDGFTTLVAPYRAERLVDGSEATLLGLTTFSGLLLAMLLQPAAGQWSDGIRERWGRGGAVGAGVVLALVGIATFGLATGPAGFVATYVLIQAGAAVAQAGQQGFIPDLIPARGRGVAAGWKGLMDVGGATVGFVVLGSLLGEAGLWAALGATAALLVVFYLLSIVLIRERRRSDAPILRRHLRDAYRLDLRIHATFVRIVAARFAFLLSIFAVGRFFVLFVGERLSLGARDAVTLSGGLLASLALATAIAAIPSGWAADRWGRARVMRVGVVTAIAGMAGLAFAGSSAQMLAFGMLMAMGSAAFSAANWAAAADLAPAPASGRVMARANFGTAGAAAGAGLFGPLIDAGEAVGDGMGFAALFGASLLALCASLWILRNLERSTTTGP